MSRVASRGAAPCLVIVTANVIGSVPDQWRDRRRRHPAADALVPVAATGLPGLAPPLRWCWWSRARRGGERSRGARGSGRRSGDDTVVELARAAEEPWHCIVVTADKDCASGWDAGGCARPRAGTAADPCGDVTCAAAGADLRRRPTRGAGRAGAAHRPGAAPGCVYHRRHGEPDRGATALERSCRRAAEPCSTPGRGGRGGGGGGLRLDALLPARPDRVPVVTAAGARPRGGRHGGRRRRGGPPGTCGDRTGRTMPALRAVPAATPVP